MVDGRGHVLTDNHVIAGCGDVRVTGAAGGTPVGATLMANDARLDLAVLRTAQAWPSHAQSRKSVDLRPGEPVVVTGFPLNGLVSPEMAVTTGSVTSGGQGNDKLLQFSAPSSQAIAAARCWTEPAGWWVSPPPSSTLSPWRR